MKSNRILILGSGGRGIVHETPVDLSLADRSYGSPAQARLEAELLAALYGQARQP